MPKIAIAVIVVAVILIALLFVGRQDGTEAAQDSANPHAIQQQ